MDYSTDTDEAPRTKRQYYVRRWGELKTQRSPFDTSWREIAEYVQPRRSRFFTTDRQGAGAKKEFNIINSTPTLACETNAAGMQEGMTSPTRPWKALTTEDKTLAELDDAKTWLGIFDDRMDRVLAGSNFYDKMHEFYLDIGPFCTSVLHIEEDVQNVIRAYVFPVGSYVLSANAKGEVDTCIRALQMTVRQLVDEFVKDPHTGEYDWSKVSRRVKQAWDTKRYDEWQDVLHVIEPNTDYVPGRIGPNGKLFRSCWLELGAEERHDTFLREAGFDEQPFMAGRWNVTGEDVYGYGPGMTAIGDCKTLQLLEREALRLTERLADPPMVGPSSMRNEPVDLDPGGVNYEDPAAPGRGFRVAMELPPQGLAAIEGAIERVDMRIRKIFREDIWLMLANLAQDGGAKTATEVVDLRAEKMLQLGPMLERLQHEVLRLVVTRVASIMLRRGLVPPPPEVLQGQALKIEYRSMLAQAQRMAHIQALKELTLFVLSLAQTNPDALDNLDEDGIITEFAESLSVPPQMLRSQAARDAVRQARAQARAAAQAQAQAQQQAETAKTLGDTNTTDDNALTRVMRANGLA